MPRPMSDSERREVKYRRWLQKYAVDIARRSDEELRTFADGYYTAMRDAGIYPNALNKKSRVMLDRYTLLEGELERRGITLPKL